MVGVWKESTARDFPNTLSLGCGVSALIRGSRRFLPGAPHVHVGEMLMSV